MTEVHNLLHILKRYNLPQQIQCTDYHVYFISFYFNTYLLEYAIRSKPNTFLFRTTIHFNASFGIQCNPVYSKQRKPCIHQFSTSIVVADTVSKTDSAQDRHRFAAQVPLVLGYPARCAHNTCNWDRKERASGIISDHIYCSRATQLEFSCITSLCQRNPPENHVMKII